MTKITWPTESTLVSCVALFVLVSAVQTYAKPVVPFELLDRAPYVLERHPLIAVHHEQHFDVCGASARGLDTLVEEFKKRHLPVVFLASSPDGDALKLNQPGWPGKLTQNSWVGQRRQADFVLDSGDGDHDVRVKVGEVTLTGGFFGACFLRAIQRTVQGHFATTSSKLRINVPMNAVYAMEAMKPVKPGVECAQTLEEYYRDGNLAEILLTLGGRTSKNDKSLFLTGTYFGGLDRRDYAVDYFVDGRPVGSRVGSGSKIIEIQLWTGNNHPYLRTESATPAEIQPSGSLR